MLSTRNTERTVAAVMVIAVLATSMLEGVGCIALLLMPDKRRPPIRLEGRMSAEDVMESVETTSPSWTAKIVTPLDLLRFLLLVLPNDEHCRRGIPVGKAARVVAGRRELTSQASNDLTLPVHNAAAAIALAEQRHRCRRMRMEAMLVGCFVLPCCRQVAALPRRGFED